MVQWTTRDSGNPVVKWGTQPGQYTHTTPARSSTYTVQDMCGPPADSIGWVDPGTFHAALLEGLEPGTLYYYVVGDEVGALGVSSQGWQQSPVSSELWAHNLL